MRNRTFAALASALFLTTAASVASAQLPQLPGLPPPLGPTDPNQPQQPAQPGAQPAQPAQPTLPGGIPVPPQLQPYLPQQPGQPAQPAQPGYGQPYAPQPNYGQPYAPQPNYGQPYAPYAPGYGQPQPGYGQPYQPYGMPQQPNVRTKLEIGYLYGVSIAYGAGVGIWVDAEAYAGKKVDPGIAMIAPLLFGAAMPVGVFFADRRPMREGLPSAIASGFVVGAGEGLVIAAFGSARGCTVGAGAGCTNTANTPNSWDFRGLARSEVIGATLGGAGGIAFGLLAKPSPQRNMFISSAAGWGAIIGYQFGGGASNGKWQQANDATTLGGLVGYNIAMAGVAGASIWWTPSWNQLAWMWGGFGIGEAAAALVYPIYAATGGDPRRGLIFQGVAGSVGAIAGAFIGHRDHPQQQMADSQDDWEKNHRFAKIRGGSLMPVQGGAGAMMMGELW